MFVKLNNIDLRLFSQKLLAQRFSSPMLLLKYYNLMLKQNQTLYEYISAAFERRQKFRKSPRNAKKLFKTKRRFYKPRISKILRFIKKAAIKKRKYESYINNQIAYANRFTFSGTDKEYAEYIAKKIYSTKKNLPFERFYLSKTDESLFSKKYKLLTPINLKLNKKKLKKNYKKIKKPKANLKDLAQLKSSRLLTRFRNLFAKKGKLSKAEKIVFRATYIMKLCLKKRKVKAKVWKISYSMRKQKRQKIRVKKTNALINKFFLKVLASARPILWLKSVKKGKSFVVQKPISLSLQRSTSLCQRGIRSSILKRSERSIIKRIASEFISIYKRKPSQTQNDLSVLHKNLRASYALL